MAKGLIRTRHHIEKFYKLKSQPQGVALRIQPTLNSGSCSNGKAYCYMSMLDVEEIYNHCDPEKENLCLYGHPSEQWEVNLPAEEVPPELPEHVLGINFARDGKQEKDWLSLVVVHRDSWLLAIAFYFGARFGFDRADRKRLFNMINELPTMFVVVTGAAKKQLQEKSSGSNHGGNKSKSNSKARGSESVGKHSKAMQSTDEEKELDEEDEHVMTY
ncbi:hypothetical protein K1719_019447 [Acacia pycnantha]|nr:hypothetical protein K1719_019447 [Acacia pycnantha]